MNAVADLKAMSSAAYDGLVQAGAFVHNDFNEPEPDVDVLHSRPDLWLDGHARTNDDF